MPNKTTWNSSLLIGDPQVDKQHEELFNTWDELKSALENKDTFALEGLRVKFLKYAVFHFSEEEALMETYRYPSSQLEHHQKEHADFLLKLESYSSELEKFSQYLENWLIHHVKNEDGKIGTWIKDNPL